jgi:GntR family transcriptional regulator/MocR family aminotransferase
LVGDLSHYAANMIFQQSGRHYQNNPIDEGLDVDYIKTRFVKGQFACLYSNVDCIPTVSLLTAERP